MIKVDKNLCSTLYHTMSGHWGRNQLPTPQTPPKCCWIWSGDTSISSFEFYNTIKSTFIFQNIHTKIRGMKQKGKAKLREIKAIEKK